MCHDYIDTFAFLPIRHRILRDRFGTRRTLMRQVVTIFVARIWERKVLL